MKTPVRSSFAFGAVALLMLMLALPARAQDVLPRRGMIGVAFQPGEDGVVVNLVQPGSPADAAGIKAGDVLVSVNGTQIATPADLAVLRRLAGGSTATLVFIRDGAERRIAAVRLGDVTRETVDGSVVRYDSVRVPGGYALRTIITEPIASPLAKDGRAPAFVFVQGIYCASLDRPQAPDAVDTRLVHAMAKAGYVTIRVDKAGLGDSQGPPCESIDFETERVGYEAALDQVRGLASVDPERVYVFGHSMGGVMAPYLMAHARVRGAIVYGTLVRTWFEYQMENTRRQMALNGASASDIAEALQAEAVSSAMVLIEKKTLGDVWARRPDLKPEGAGASVMLDETHMSSRHMSFFHQLQDLNLAKAWEASRGSVLAIHGEYDWVTTGEDHEQIAAIVNARTAGAGTSMTLPKADHGFTIHDSLQASLSAMGQGRWDGSLPKAVLAWIDGVEGRATSTPAPAQGEKSLAPPKAPEGPTAERAAARAGFPQAWLGHWKGDATVGAGENVQRFTMELIVARTDSPDRYTWTIVYDGAAGRQERPYALVVKDGAKGLYAIDEGNGIVLDARLLEGALYSHFLVQGSRIATREKLEGAGTPEEHISVEMLTTVEDSPGATGGKDGVPEVKTWAPVSIQKARLTRVDAGKDADAKKAVAPSAALLPEWTMLKTERYPGKQDDLFFASPSVGWYVNGAGKIFKTVDGGETWAEKVHKPGTYFRCIAFVDEKIGFAGNIGPGYFPNVTDATPLYRTEDGGESWEAVTTIDGPPVAGLCALEVVREEFVNAGKLDTRVRVVGTGRVGGPTALIYSDDLGKTWSQIDIKDQAAMAFDVHFFDRRHGVIAGASDADVSKSHALILTTDDGGATWTRAYESTRPYELTWKISFPTRQVGYVTIQAYNPDPAASQRFVAKTTDGGKTWNEVLLADDAKVREFGIAFIDENRGWVGAAPAGYQTLDGGKTWAATNFGNAVNKIRLLASPEGVHAFAIGVNVSKTFVPTASR